MPVRDHFRAHARRRVDLGATLRDRQSTEEHDVRIRDLGLGGAGIEVSEAQLAYGYGLLDPEVAVTLEVITPNLWDPLSLRGRVAWVRRGAAGRPVRAGIRFEHHDAGALYALYQLLGAGGFDL